MLNKIDERISLDPDIMVGKPVIKGTRVTVESILRKLAAGWDVEEILDAHPHLQAEDISAALEFAADQVSVRIAKHSKRLVNTKLTDLVGIGSANAEKLISAGVESLAILLQRGKTKEGREELALTTRLNEEQILNWVNMADLFRIRGVGEEYAELLDASGVNTVIELSKRMPANLHRKMVEVNTAKKLVRQLPTEKQVASWVEQAKTLQPLVED
ncbi:MAG: DUF433 domain-containing protein [Anaerolineae bacterium]|nr:DUF433 domain-containing protein [Anaerolineae bacterium]